MTAQPKPAPAPKHVIDPNDAETLKDFGAMFWLDELHPLRGGEGLEPAFRDEISLIEIDHVARVEVVTGLDFGCSAEKAVILAFAPADETVTGLDVLRASWAAYMLSLKATMDSPTTNGRAHVGGDADAIDVANRIVAELGADATPCAEIYGSEGTYLEAIDATYDHETRTLRLDPSIGS